MHDLPVFEEIAVKGFPVWALENGGEFRASLFDALGRSSKWAGDPLAQRGLARLAAGCVAGQRWSVLSDQAEWFLSLIEGRTPSGSEEARGWLSNFSFTYGLPGWGRRLVDAVGGMLSLDDAGTEGGWLDETSVEALCIEVGEDRTSPGLLRVLAREGRQSDLRGILPRLIGIMEDEEEDPNCRSIALVIALQHWGGMRDDERSAVRERIATHDGAALLQGTAVVNAIEHLETSSEDVTDREVVSWLVHLQSSAPVADNEAVVRTARRIAARDPGLGDAYEWLRLGLAPGIANLLWRA